MTSINEVHDYQEFDTEDKENTLKSSKIIYTLDECMTLAGGFGKHF